MYAKKSVSMKVVVLLLAVVLLIGCTVGGTLAWLIAQTDPVTNTFAVGKIEIALAETVDKDSFKVVPGATEKKDPTVTVKAGSEECYVYVYVENNLVIDGVTVGTLNIDTSKWGVVKTNGNKTLYRYFEVVDASAAEKTLPVFTTVTYSHDKITEKNIGTLANQTIVVDAYAHQSENVADSTTTTDAAALAHFGLT